MEQITLGQIAAGVAIITALWIFAERIIKAVNDAFTKAIKPIKDDLQMLNDVTYEMLKHMATNNNSGGMQKVLDKYVEHKIKN